MVDTVTQVCLDGGMATSAERQRAYRARKGARVGEHPGPVPSAPCGTVSAYKRHLRHGEGPDVACRAAWAAYHRERYGRRPQREGSDG